MIKQHQKWESTTQQTDDDPTATIGGLDDLLAAVSGIDDQDHQQEDLAALIESFGTSGGLNNKPVAPLRGSHWDEQHNHLRRLSPLGSEQQQQQKQYYHQYRHNQIHLPPSSSFNPSDGGIPHYGGHLPSTKGTYNRHNNRQQQPASAILTNYPYAAAYNVAVGSTALTVPVNSSTPSLPSPLSSSSSVPYNYYDYQLLATKSSDNPTLPSPTYNSITATTTGDIDLPMTPMMNALHLSDNNGVSSQNTISSYSSDNDVFPNAAAAVAVLQRPLPSQYTGGIGYGAASGYGYHHPHTLLASRQEQLYSPQKYQQQISTTNAGATSVGTAGVFVQQNQQKMIGGSSGLSTSISQPPLPMSSPQISSATVNSCSLAAIVQQSTTSGGTSTVGNFYHQLPSQLQQQQQQQQQQLQQQLQQQQQQQQQQHQQQQKQQLQNYQQHLQEQKPHQQHPQQPQLYQQQLYPQQQPQPQPYQQQPPQVYQQQQPHQLTATVGSTTGNFYYPSPLQQQTSQLYQPPQHQQQVLLQPTSTSGITGSLQQSPLLSNNSISVGSSYYQQLQHHHPPSTVISVPTNLNNYIYQQPPMAAVAFNQHQQQQQYYQQQQLPIAVDGGLATMTSTITPILNLLDDDLLISGPPPIQPEKIGASSGNEAITTSAN